MGPEFPCASWLDDKIARVREEMVSSRTNTEKNKNMARASMGAGLRLRVGKVSTNAEDSRYDDVINKGAKKRITGTDIVVNPSSRKVDRGIMSRGGKRWMGLDGWGRCSRRMLRRIARSVRVYEASPGTGARVTAKHKKTRKNGRLVAGSSRIVARE